MEKPQISIVACIGRNRAIGKDNKLLWHLPGDLKHFRELTSGHVVIMGQRTFESLGSKPLPKRINIVLSQDKAFRAPRCVTAYSMPEALEIAQRKEKSEIFFIGGGMVYKQALPLADRLYLTVVDDASEADTFFPKYQKEFRVVSRCPGSASNPKYEFIELVK